MSSHAEDIRRQNETLVDLRGQQTANDEELEKARADQAKARGAHMQKEKRVKKAEKTLENKVCPTILSCLYCTYGLQRPELVQIEAQIAHSRRKKDNAQKIIDQVQKEADKQRSKLDSLQRDLQVVQNAADAAQGANKMPPYIALPFLLIRCNYH